MTTSWYTLFPPYAINRFLRGPKRLTFATFVCQHPCTYTRPHDADATMRRRHHAVPSREQVDGTCAGSGTRVSMGCVGRGERKRLVRAVREQTLVWRM